MAQNTSESAAQPESGADATDSAKPTAKPRRPRRMAREGTATTPPASPNGAAPDASTTAPSTPKAESKIARVIALLGRDQGATLAELTEATGWLPHTTRAALTGLRKKRRTIEKSKRGDATCYTLAEGA
jgi:hypothetical protein